MKRKSNLNKELSRAIAQFWKSRESQSRRQSAAGRSDQGARGAVTGGAQMDGFINLLKNVILEAGAPESTIFDHRHLELPGFFRPTKEWDLLVVKEGQLIAVVETKSQVGPSFGNNFNNRTEEAMGSAVDLWTAFRDGAFNKTVKPWLGYLFLLEACPESQRPVKVQEPHFKVFPEFATASYAERYEIFSRKLVRERHYNVACLLTSDRRKGPQGQYKEPAEDLRFEIFARSLRAQIQAFGGTDNK